METNASPPVSMKEPGKPRFEAFVMTGDAILNLSRTTHSPTFFPIHSKRRKYVEKNETTEKENLTALPLVRNSTSEENLHKNIETNKVSDKVSDKVSAEEETVARSLNGEVTTNDRIVWTYNAPMTEQEVRRLEADQFWSSTKISAPPTKQPKQLVDMEKTHKESHRNSNTPPEDAGNETDNSSAKNETVPEIISSPDEDRKSASSSPLLSKQSLSQEEDSDADSLQSVHYSPKGVDMPSAIRLAKRYVFFLQFQLYLFQLFFNFNCVYRSLFALDGFQKSDVSRHLSKNNDFNRVVAEEYLTHFEFENISLDSALRRFLHAFQLTGESSERDRVLVHFSRRFLYCNPNSFASQVHLFIFFIPSFTLANIFTNNNICVI